MPLLRSLDLIDKGIYKHAAPNGALISFDDEAPPDLKGAQVGFRLGLSVLSCRAVAIRFPRRIYLTSPVGMVV
jgi:hypothetical protein